MWEDTSLRWRKTFRYYEETKYKNTNHILTTIESLYVRTHQNSSTIVTAVQCLQYQIKIYNYEIIRNPCGK